MSSTNQRAPFERVVSIHDLGLHDHCIVIADRALPRPLLESFADPILVDAGEGLKTLAALERLADNVLQRRSSRPMTLVAVGGGSVGDAVGFLASILWRGVDLWQVPTTLVAMVDSAHGGKTAVNLGAAKNQLGTFYPAQRVLLVEDVVRLLPMSVRKEGLAELLKALWLGDAPASSALTLREVETMAFAPGDEAMPVLLPLLERAVHVKTSIVEQDPREEKGIRTVLNLGHTLGHALELTLGIHHGLAVSWGLAAALRLSMDFGMSEAESRALLHHLYPLLTPLPGMPSDDAMLAAMHRDKKRSDNILRSVVLQSAGRPLVVTSIPAREWLRALHAVVRDIADLPVTVSIPSPRAVRVQLEAGKSAMNRALIIAAQRIGRTSIVGRSEADDVRHMVRALRTLGYPIEDSGDGFVVDNLNRALFPTGDRDSRVIHVGEGGTTFRFLVALCCTSVKRSKIVASPSLLRRPHEALFRALRSGGASIEPFDDESGQGVVVAGWEHAPEVFSVDCSLSSQYASAIALLAVGAERPFGLRLMGEVASRSYFDMTLGMLREAGVDVLAHGDLVMFNQSDRLNEKLTMMVEQDAGSRAVWSVARALGHPMHPSPMAHDSMQPDSAVDDLLASLLEAGGREARLDLAATPDLLPVLAAAVLGLRRRVLFTGLETLRHKESNRLDDFARQLEVLGAHCETGQGTLLLDARETSATADVSIASHADHRIVMAAALMALNRNSVRVDGPWSVRKSYPGFWDDARAAGWSMEPAYGPAERTQ